MTNYQPKRILVTGGAGFMGSHFVRLLLKHKVFFVLNLDKLTYAGSLDKLPNITDSPQYAFIQGDVNDTSLVNQLLKDYQIDSIVHFAAESHVDRSIGQPNEFIQTNINGIFNLLNCAYHYWQTKYNLDPARCRFHYISTDEIYGSLSKQAPAALETNPYLPNSPYAASKASANHLLRAYRQTYGLPTVCSVSCNNYGPYQNLEKFIPTVISSCLNQQPIPTYGNGENVRDWLYVDDHNLAALQVLTQGQNGEIYNIGANDQKRNLDVVEAICKLFNERFPQNAPHQKLIQFVADRPGHDLRYAINHNKLSQQLNWQPKTPFLKGLGATLEHYLQELSS
ncbi:MAG: dTDP-glucose 4,6-dehydratase [Gammaproteobacteria bacterium]|nr:dTDP-glucose 4,6-dehydratase [Gammaproteobacteria bacterium]